MTLLPESYYGTGATNLGAAEYLNYGERELTSEELTRCMGELAELYPDAAGTLQTLMHCFGDAEHTAAAAARGMEDQPIRDIIIDGPLSYDPDALDIISRYFNVKREEQLQIAFARLTQTVPLPEVFEALAILESPLATKPEEEPDRFALLAAKAAKREQITLWHGLDSNMVDDDYNAWLGASRKITGAVLWLEENPPAKIIFDGSPDDEDFYKKKIAVMHHLKDALNDMVNFSKEYGATNPETGEAETLTGPFTVLGPALIRKPVVNEQDEVVATEDELAIRFADSTGKKFGGELSSICMAFMEDPTCLTDEAVWQVALFNALDMCDDANDFKNVFTLAVFALYNGQPIYLYLDEDSTFGEVMKGSRQLQAAVHNVSRHYFDERETGGGVTSFRGEPDSRYVSNIDSRTFKSRGTLENHSGRYVSGSMLCFTADRSIAFGSSQEGGSFDLRLVTELLRSEADKYAYPEIPGFKLVGYRPAEEWSDKYVLDYAVLDEDPYQEWDSEVEPENIKLLASKLDDIGMKEMANELRSANCCTLQEVFGIVQPYLVYGTGQRKVAGTAEHIEDLSYFVEQDQMVGVCSVFAALTAFSAEQLLPDAEEVRVIGGYRLRQSTISADGHAQVMVRLSDNTTHIIELDPQGARQKHASESAEVPALTPAESFAVSAKNMFASLHAALLDKYQSAHNAASLQRALIRQAPENFGRQLYGLLLEAQDLNGSSPEDQIADISRRVSFLNESLAAWQAAPEQTRRQLAARFGKWSTEEAAFFANILRTVEETLQLA